MHAKHYWWHALTAIVLLQGSGFSSLPDHFLSFTLTLSTLCCYSLHIRIIIIIKKMSITIVLKNNFSQCQQLKLCILTSFSIATKCYKYNFMYVSICEYHSWARSSLIFFTAVFLSSLVYLNVNVSQPCFSFLTLLLSCMNVFLLSSSTLSLPSYLIFLFFPPFSTLCLVASVFVEHIQLTVSFLQSYSPALEANS